MYICRVHMEHKVQERIVIACTDEPSQTSKIAGKHIYGTRIIALDKI